MATSDRDDQFILGVWLWTEAGALVLTPASVCVAGELEVCTLAIDTPEALLERLSADDTAQHRELSNPYLRIPPEELPSVLPPPERALPWPFPQFEVTILRAMSWVEPTQTMAPDLVKPGAAFKDARVECTSASGILFKGQMPSERLLISATDPPVLRMLVTRDTRTIERYVERSIEVTLEQYSEDYLDSLITS